MRSLVILTAFAVLFPAVLAGPGSAEGANPVLPFPIVTIAHIDTGINPYHVAFRDTSAFAYVHPSAYIPGYPKDVPALELTLDAASYEDALAADAAVWADVERNQLYWIPGTRIIGAISMGSGGTNCPFLSPIPPANILGSTACTERIILDDHGHGTMTATRMAGEGASLAPTARIVSIEGLGAGSVEWAAAQGWIDVQTNSWLSLVPNVPLPDELEEYRPRWLGSLSRVGDAFEAAADVMLTFAASGNGAGYLGGFVPTPTYGMSTAAPGVILVGAHDNGKMSLWSGAPPHVVADGYAGLAAAHEHLTRLEPHPVACCTSAAAPYAAGGGAALILEARRILGDIGVGLRGDAIAIGEPTESGPLADGKLTLDEAEDILRRSAEARPGEGVHDGAAHWLGHPQDGPSEWVDDYGVGANPYCQGCTTTPLGWQEVPDVGTSIYPFVGFGAVNERSAALAADVLLGEAALPERALEQALYAADQEVREPLY